MGDSVERSLEETISVLQAARRAKLLSVNEIKDVIRKRRNHEYAVSTPRATRDEFLKYAAFERELSLLLQKRADRRKIKKKKVQLMVGKTGARVNLVYSRAVKKFKGDEDLWIHYARHCVMSGSTRAASRVLAKALAFRGDSERIWLTAMSLHFDVSGDATGARSLAQRALRALPDSVQLWKEYFRLELLYLAKLIIRRVTIGLPAPTGQSEGGQEQQNLFPAPGEGKSQSGHTDVVVLGDEASAVDASAVDASADDASADDASADDDSADDASADDASADEDSADEDSADENSADEDLEVSSAKVHDLNSADSDVADNETDASGTDTELSDQRTRTRLSFWDGGVPFAVFRNAFSKVDLTEEDRADVWIIAVDTPYVPSKLLLEMSLFLKEESPNSVISKIIGARSEWDCTHAESKRNQKDGTSDATKKRLVDASLKAAFSMKDIVVNEVQELNSNKNLKGTLLSLLGSLRKAVTETAYSRAFDAAVSSITSTLGAEVGQNMDAQTNSNEQDYDIWTLQKFSDFLEKELLDPLTDDFVESLKRRTLVPFRGIQQEKVISLFLKREVTLMRVREFTEQLLHVPPVTMQTLRGAIDAELRIRNDSPQEFRVIGENEEESSQYVRKLFTKAASLGAAKRDVDFWLCYADFERRVCHNSKNASQVCWKAAKVLGPIHADQFTERQTLRTLMS